MTFGQIFVPQGHNNTPKRVGVAAAALVALGLAAPVGAQEAPCDRFAGPPTVAGTVADPALVEISGVAASRAHRGVLWVHNDSGGLPALTALSDTGSDLGTYRVPGAQATDWEDMAAGPGPDPDRDYLYVGDIGDNGEARDAVQVHRVPEPEEAPDGGDGRFEEDVVVTLRYPGGPVDAEALLIDPETGDLYIVGKRQEEAPVFLAEADAVAEGGDVQLTRVTTLTAPAVGEPPGPLGLVTGGDVSPDGSVILLRTYLSIAAYARPEGQPLGAAFEQTPCAAPRADEPQGEAVGFLADGSAYVTISEGMAQPINRVAVAPPLAVPTTTTTSPPPARAEEEDEDDGVPAGVWVGAAAAVVVVAAAGGWAATRRRRR
jgi:hypothetical protein